MNVECKVPSSGQNEKKKNLIFLTSGPEGKGAHSSSLKWRDSPQDPQMKGLLNCQSSKPKSDSSSPDCAVFFFKEALARHFLEWGDYFQERKKDVYRRDLNQKWLFLQSREVRYAHVRLSTKCLPPFNHFLTKPINGIIPSTNNKNKAISSSKEQPGQN